MEFDTPQLRITRITCAGMADCDVPTGSCPALLITLSAKGLGDTKSLTPRSSSPQSDAVEAQGEYLLVEFTNTPTRSAPPLY